MVLPGESLAKYGKKTSRRAQPTETAVHEQPHEPTTGEREERGFRQDSESAGPIPRHFEQQEEAQARVEAPQFSIAASRRTW